MLERDITVASQAARSFVEVTLSLAVTPSYYLYQFRIQTSIR